MELSEHVRGYLTAEGWAVRAGGRDLQIASRLTLGGEEEHLCVWTPSVEPSRGLGSREGTYQARFKEAEDQFPGAQKFVVLDSFSGVSREFLLGARRWFNVRVLVPAQFFDTASKWEESPELVSAVKDLRRNGEARMRERVQQPYVKNESPGGSDLLDELVTAARGRNQKPISVVVGPAGVGKSFLFEALFYRLYEDFVRDKQAQVLSPRPFPLLPQHLTRADSPTIKSILSAYLATEFARPLGMNVFEWRLTHGMAMWLIDGLDEVISQDPQFFEYLMDLLTRPDASPPRILICIRDSLLDTNDDFRLFTTELPDFVDIYRLTEWDEACQTQFAEIRFGRNADRFNRFVRDTPGADRLAATPFYCSLLADLYESGDSGKAHSTLSLLEFAVSAIIDREYQKRLLDANVIDRTGVREFAEAIAAENFEGGFQGVPVGEVRELASLVLPGTVLDDELDTFVQGMTQLALFASGGEGRLQFAQELLEQYLLGGYIGSLLGNAERLVLNLGVRDIPPGWVTLTVAGEIAARDGQQASIVAAIFQAGNRESAFRNLVQLAIYSAPRRDILRDVSFERRDLRQVVFRDLDLLGASFRDANLANCVFDGCDLRGVDFQGATLNETSFVNLKSGSLRDSLIGNLSGFYSIRTDQGVVEDHLRAGAWFESQIGSPAKIEEPCATALQLRSCFRKLVRPGGRGGRDWVGWKALVAGKRYADPETVAKAAVRHGYLIREEYRDRVLRPGGDLLSEIAAYVSNMTLSAGLNALLDDACPAGHETHVPRGD